ncbi:MAG: hypothetical protein WCU88_10285 [Elusimicrobiota bacterium]|jgi:hypothetical protein
MHCSLLLIALFSSFACAEDVQTLRQQLEELQRAAQELQRSMPQPAPNMPSFGLPATPQDKVAQVVENTNRMRRGILSSLSAFSGSDEPEIPVPAAIPFKGRIIVRGKDSDPPSGGWSSLSLSYAVTEEFVGYVHISEYYDPKTGKPNGKKEYLLGSASVNISVEQSGRQCVSKDSGSCRDWRDFSTHQVDPGDRYPAIHEWALKGGSENGRIILEIESPTVYFTSADGKAGRKLGCYGTKIERSPAQFAQDLNRKSLSLTSQVGSLSTITPRCEPGSSIELSLSFGDAPQDSSEAPDRCRQTESLLKDIEFLLHMRDAYESLGPGAQSEEDLMDLVEFEIQRTYPGFDLTAAGSPENGGGSHEFCSEETNTPDLCAKGVPRPLCEWEGAALDAHEQTHVEDIQADPSIKPLFCNTQYQMEHYPSASDLDRQQAKVRAKLDGHAYNEQAKHARDSLEEELSSSACGFGPGFFTRMQEALARIR